MAIDYSGFAIPKPRPRALDKQDRTTAKRTRDERESEKVKRRSQGQCEVRMVFTNVVTGALVMRRCVRRASEVHHILGGRGRRGVGESALAKNKLHQCGICHDLITRHILQGHWTDVNDRAGTITFVRLK